MEEKRRVGDGKCDENKEGEDNEANILMSVI